MTKLIELNQISIFSEKKEIIRDFNLEIEAGDFVAINGPSGSGKSTLLKLMAQLLSTNLSYSGEYILKEKDSKHWDPIKLRQTVSYCYQSPNLFGQTVYDNLNFPYTIRNESFDEQRVLQYLENVKLDSSYLHKSIHELSGGEKQRIALVRNVQFQPDVLLLDEVTSALDNRTRLDIWEWLDQYRAENGTTFIMISHHDDDQQRAEKTVTIEKLTNRDKEEDHD